MHFYTRSKAMGQPKRNMQNHKHPIPIYNLICKCIASGQSSTAFEEWIALERFKFYITQ